MNVEVFCFDAVAPVRERGLKLLFKLTLLVKMRRSREGAWIEIRICLGIGMVAMSLP